MNAPTPRTKAPMDGADLPEWRIKAVLWVVVAACVVLSGRLFYLQVLENPDLGKKAHAAQFQSRRIEPPRGTISDRNGVVLAANRNADRLFADPSAIADPADAAIKLAPIIGESAQVVREKLDGDASWVSLATRLTPEQSEQVRELDLYGVGLEPSPSRVYPNGALASHVLGFTNFENVGSYGVEGAYNKYLTGEPGEMAAERDSSGNWLAIGRQQGVPPKSGADLELTLDSTIQYYAEDELRRVVKEQGAKGGSIVVMDPYTGGILAMAAHAGYDPAKFNTVKNAATFINPTVSQMYEPGSTFKIITMATGLAEGVITPEHRFNDPGSMWVHGSLVRNWDSSPHPWESMTEVLMNSANVGAAHVSNLVGRDAFYRRLREFGMGRPTGVDLEGETSGMLILPSSEHWAPINLYTNAYGQGIAVTPLQLITAQAAVANGGKLMRPFVVRKVVRDGKLIKENKPTVVRRVLEPEVAETLKGMMRIVVEQGEYQMARLDNYTIGGKTGTSSIARNGKYDENLTIASFVGYSPVKHPKFIALIKIDEPRKSRWGSEVAAPAFKRLARRIYAYMNIPPDKPGAAQTVAP